MVNARNAVTTACMVSTLGLVAWWAAPDQQELEPFVGVTTNGSVQPDLFTIRSTGVSTEPISKAAEAFLGSLSDELRTSATFPVDDDEWRQWNNVHRAERQGVSFKDMSERQQAMALAMLQASLSARGLQKSRNVMRLNRHLGELIDNLVEYGDDLYWITIMGTPSTNDPWGWQLDGHHLDINYFVLGDQVVMTPTFMGSEPVIGSGAYADVTVMQEEQAKGVAFMESLSPEQQRAAIIDSAKGRRNALSQAFRDNLVLDYAGFRTNHLGNRQRELFLDLVHEFVGNMRDGHAEVKMEEVEAHLDETYFAWIGDTGPESVFYFRVHSPVILIEFDHQSPVALEGRAPTRKHVHAVVRTPNGNDYGKDLLRQHYELHKTNEDHGH